MEHEPDGKCNGEGTKAVMSFQFKKWEFILQKKGRTANGRPYDVCMFLAKFNSLKCIHDPQNVPSEISLQQE